jgi:protocadherin alpha
MDYPSLSMIAAKLQEKSIFAVFAVTQAVITSYRSLSSMFPNIDVQEIKRDSSNLVSAIENAYYQSISSSVELQATALDGVNITFQSHCGGNTANTQKCTTLAAGEVSTFTVYLELTDCNKVHGPRRMVISAGIYGETVVNIDPICECGCSFNKIYNKSFCSGNGMIVCGLCECNDQSYGNNCQCTERGNTTSNQLPCRLSSCASLILSLPKLSLSQ